MDENVSFTLDQAVDEVFGLLTGLELQYLPESDRYRAVVRCLNRALRSNSLEKEWSYYSSLESAGTTYEGQREFQLRPSVRPRIVSDDSLRLCLPDGRPVRWAYFLPRDALSKYIGREGLWVAVTRNTVNFSRPLHSGEAGLEIMLPVMREPMMFELPPAPEDDNEEYVVPEEVRLQELDFVYPDVITLRAAFYYAQTDPVMQPRVQTIEAQYKDLMYQIIERDDRNTDSPFQNDFAVPVMGGLHSTGTSHWHPHSDERR